MPKMRAVEVAAPHDPFAIVEREIPDPGPGKVRIKVEACGICHGDSVTKEGILPFVKYPRVPGHEVAGRVDAIGAGVARWQPGQRVGIGWHGGHCGTCDNCRRGLFFACQRFTEITGLTTDGGYAEYLIARAEAVAALPDDLSAVEAAPLLCAGLTTFNCLRHSGARMGDTVAVLGLGGLGHLGVQYAAKAGFRTVAIARGSEKEALARQLGAWRYIDSRAADPAVELRKLGGAKVILATATQGDAMAAVLGGLAVDGVLMAVGAAHKMTFAPASLIGGRTGIRGWHSGVAIDSEDTLGFSVLTGVRSMNETFPLDRVNEAYDRMLKGEARFRVVLTM